MQHARTKLICKDLQPCLRVAWDDHVCMTKEAKASCMTHALNAVQKYTCVALEHPNTQHAYNRSAW